MRNLIPSTSQNKLFLICTLFLVLMLALLTVQAADAPTLSDHVKNRILKAQLTQSQVQSRMNALQAEAGQLQSAWTSAQAELDAARKEAFKEAKVDEKDWQLDMGKLEFTPVPKAEAKKP